MSVSDQAGGVVLCSSALKHHTSKLRDFSDLIHVETFGFRGEALSSLCALSDLSVVTCHEAAQVGTRLVFDHDGRVVQRCPQPRQQGTTVSLGQLFHTLPVRHKEFQRNIKKEFTRMVHVLQAYGIISTGVRVTCSNQTGQGKRSPVLSTSGSPCMRDNIGAVYGAKQVSKLVNEVYHMYNRHQYPFVALNIAVASECVDVNVTPDKRQIFLQEEKLLLAILKTSLMSMYESGSRPAGPCGGEAVLEPGGEDQPTAPRARSSLNLAGLRAAFASHTKPGTKDPAAGDSKQKTLQSFFKGSERTTTTTTHSIRSPVNPLRERTTPSLAGRSALDAFRYGKTPDRDIEDSGKGSSLSEGDSQTTATPQSPHCAPECDERPRVTDLTVSEESSAPPPSASPRSAPEGPVRGIKAEPSTSCEEEVPAPSPDSKRARTEESRVSVVPSSSSSSTGPEPSGSSLSRVDAPVAVQKRRAVLRFCLREVAGRLGRLREQQTQRDAQHSQYRRFRAKISPGDNQSAEEELRKEISKDSFKDMQVLGQFNLGFIITKLNSDLFMIDQHATDEKYNFETLQQHTVLQGQRLIAPQKLHLTAVGENVLMENLEIFQKNGFDFLIDEDAQAMERVRLVSLPTSKNWTFGPADIEELIFMLSDAPGVMCRPSRVRHMFASRACRKSVMIGTALSVSEMRKLVVHMGELEQPWNCPHGRPTMRHLVNLDLLAQH
ncbi:hypothetical protein CRUP_024738 [Coryphaenoides rupestris]|nr:hypothetical protein CRUP_024738 [Coryphaenoides rupestris]